MSALKWAYMQMPLNTMQMYIVLNLYAITLFLKKTNKFLVKINFKHEFTYCK